jgi:hypothetical protein
MHPTLERLRRFTKPLLPSAPRQEPTRAVTSGTDDGASPGPHTDDLQHADASRDGAYEELLLLEKHIKEAPCLRCMNKHAITARGLLREAAGLKGGKPEDATVLAARVEEGRQMLPTDTRAALTKIQGVRLALGEILGYHGGSESEHVHAAGSPPARTMHTGST